jgi:hypothetical protein
MGSRRRQENYFRYARMHFELDSHDAYATTDDDPARLVPNPAKKRAHKQVLAARARHERALAATDAAMLEAVSPPPPGQTGSSKKNTRSARQVSRRLTNSSSCPTADETDASPAPSPAIDQRVQA